MNVSYLLARDRLRQRLDSETAVDQAIRRAELIREIRRLTREQDEACDRYWRESAERLRLRARANDELADLEAGRAPA